MLDQYGMGPRMKWMATKGWPQSNSSLKLVAKDFSHSDDDRHNQTSDEKSPSNEVPHILPSFGLHLHVAITDGGDN